MLARLDTLLTRIVILVTAALLSTFLLAYFIVEFSISSQRLQPRTALHVATVALEELQAKDWPDSLSDKELERLQITDYSLSEYPYIEPFSWGLAERVLENLGLAQDTPIGISLSGWGDRDRLAGPPGRPDRFMDEEPGRPGPMSLRPPPSERGRSASQQRARVSLEIANGNWVNIRTENISVKEPRPPLLAAVMLIVLMVGIGIWAALNAINPLRQMAKAANTLASDYKHEPLVEQGPYDVRESLRAFNRMGRRLETTVAGQRQLLAAIGDTHYLIETEG